MVEFELIKNRIQKNSRSSIVADILELLNEVQRQDDKSFPIWNPLTLLKWTFLHTTDSPLLKPVTDYEFSQLLTLVRDFEVQYNGLNFKSHRNVRQSFKIIANQQFPLQDKFHPSILSRQIVLYLQLRSQFDIDKEFERLSGINLRAFLEYSYFTYFFFNFSEVRPDIKYDGILPESYFELFKSKWREEQLAKYLNLITIREKEDFLKLQKLKNEILQLYETNFFILKPLIFFKGAYRIPHKQLFIQTIKYFVYNYLKENSAQFPEELGKRLEKYVELGLVENNIPFQNETSLKAGYQLGKTADIFIENDILVEIKAIELNPRAGVLRTQDILVNDFDQTIIKAYSQLLATAQKINPHNQYYGIVITFKEMYLGFGKDAWEEFLKSPIEQFCLKHSIDISILPPKNLCFISIEDWDRIMQVVKSGKAGLKEILLKGIEMNALDNIAERADMMEQVINKMYSPLHFTLSYLKDAHLVLDILPPQPQ